MLSLESENTSSYARNCLGSMLKGGLNLNPYSLVASLTRLGLRLNNHT
jgi:hypothetical protein